MKKNLKQTKAREQVCSGEMTGDCADVICDEPSRECEDTVSHMFPRPEEVKRRRGAIEGCGSGLNVLAFAKLLPTASNRLSNTRGRGSVETLPPPGCPSIVQQQRQEIKPVQSRYCRHTRPEGRAAGGVLLERCHGGLCVIQHLRDGTCELGGRVGLLDASARGGVGSTQQRQGAHAVCA